MLKLNLIQNYLFVFVGQFLQKISNEQRGVFDQTLPNDILHHARHWKYDCTCVFSSASVFNGNFGKIRDFDPDELMDSIVPRPTARRDRNHLASFQNFMNTGMDLAIRGDFNPSDGQYNSTSVTESNGP